MKTVIAVDLLEFIKSEDGVNFFKYKILLSDGSVLEGDDFITTFKNVSKVKESIVGFLNDYYIDFE